MFEFVNSFLLLKLQGIYVFIWLVNCPIIKRLSILELSTGVFLLASYNHSVRSQQMAIALPVTTL
jgi:hypothetical protein